MIDPDRVLRRFLADLSPPLGKPGGPCQVVQRIHQEVDNPRLRDGLVDDVESGQDLSNADAAKVYDLEPEFGAGLVRKLVLTAHVQYRMDLRSVTVNDVRKSLMGFTKRLLEWKARGNPAYQQVSRDMIDGRKIEWLDRDTNLKIVFQMTAQGTATLITAFWKGREDPLPPSSGCRVT